MDEWYKDKHNVAKLCIVLVGGDMIKTHDDLIHLLLYPEKYDGVWKLYLDAKKEGYFE